MDWQAGFLNFLNHLIATLPWLVVGGGALALISRSAIGRALLRYLNKRERDSGLTEATLHELEGLRHTLAEVVERLDAAERRAMQLLSPGKDANTLREVARVPTPV